MIERLLGFLAWTEARRMPRSRLFLRGRTGLAVWTGGSACWAYGLGAGGRFDAEALAGFVAWSGLWAILLGGPALTILATRKLRTTGTLELLLAAGVSRARMTFGVWAGQLAATLLLAAGGVGALSIAQLLGGLDIFMLLRLGAFLGVAAASATALAMPGAAGAVRPAAAWLRGLGLAALPHLAPGPVAHAFRLTLPPGATGARADLTRALNWLAERSAPEALDRIFGVAAAAPTRALGEFAALHLPLAALALAWACRGLRHEAAPTAVADAKRPALKMGDDGPSAWLHRSFPHWSWPARLGAGSAAGLLAALLALQRGEAFPYLAVAWSIAGLTAFACVPAALALAESSLFSRLHAGVPIDTEVLFDTVRERASAFLKVGVPALALAGLAFGTGMVVSGSAKPLDEAAGYIGYLVASVACGLYMAYGFLAFALRAGALSDTGAAAFARVAWGGMVWLLLGPLLIALLVAAFASMAILFVPALVAVPLAMILIFRAFGRLRRDALKALQRRHFPTQPTRFDFYE